MNITEQIAATKRLQEVWQYLFADLGMPLPNQRQFSTWLTLYGEKATEDGLTKANTWINKTNRRLNQDDLVRYASACAKNSPSCIKKYPKKEADNVDGKSTTA